jgi:hypothetical protein
MAQRRERPAQQHGGKAFDFRLSDGRTISVPANEPAPTTVTAAAVGETLVEAIAARDEAAIAACFTPDAQFRALVPRGLRERSGATDAAALINGWLESVTELRLVDSRAEEVADRLHVAYRLHVVEDGKPFVVEQQWYCKLADGLIERADLVCSGFRPRD